MFSILLFHSMVWRRNSEIWQSQEEVWARSRKEIMTPMWISARYSHLKCFWKAHFAVPSELAFKQKSTPFCLLQAGLLPRLLPTKPLRAGHPPSPTVAALQPSEHPPSRHLGQNLTYSVRQMLTSALGCWKASPWYWKQELVSPML